MIPIAPNHATHIIDRELLPCFISNVLPSWYFLENQQPKFIAGVEEVPRLRIVRCAHDIAMKLIAENVSIAPLRSPGHCLADKWKCLVTIESAELDDFAVQLEAMFGELRFAEAESARVFINCVFSSNQTHANVVEAPVIEFPKLDA